MSPSNQTLIEELKPVVSEEDKLGNRDISILKARLPPLFNQDVKSNVMDNFNDL